MATPPGSDGRLLKGGLLAGGVIAIAVVALALFSSSPGPVADEAPDAGRKRRPPRRVERTDGGLPTPGDAARRPGPVAPRLTLAHGPDGGLPAPPHAGAPQALREALGRKLTLKGRPALPAAATGGGATLDKEAIRGAIKEIQPLVRACYEQGLRQEPALGGDATLSFTIVAKDGRGLVREAEFVEERSSMANVLVQACMLDALSKASFPVPQGDGETRVTYPFRFASAPGKP